MQKTCIRTIGRSLPWGLIGMLGLLGMVERVLHRFDRDLTGTVPLNWRYARNMAVSEARNCRILCLGSSMVKFGISARMIRAETGMRTLNLAMSASNLPGNYFVFRRAIEAGARPAAILIDTLEYGVDRTQVRDNVRNFTELLNFSEILDVAWNARDPAFLATMILSRQFFSFRNRFEIRSHVLACFRGEPASSRYAGVLALRNWGANRGTWVVPRNLEFEASHQGETVRSLPSAASRTATAISLRGTYAQRFLDLAAAHGIRVFLLLPPLPPHTQERFIRRGFDLGTTQLALDLQARYPELIVIEGRRSGFPVEAFYDDIHLNSYGTASLTAEVASAMKRTLARPWAGPIWLPLPPYRQRSADPWLEDITMSSVVLRTEAARRP